MISVDPFQPQEMKENIPEETGFDNYDFFFHVCKFQWNRRCKWDFSSVLFIKQAQLLLFSSSETQLLFLQSIQNSAFPYSCMGNTSASGVSHLSALHMIKYFK